MKKYNVQECICQNPPLLSSRGFEEAGDVDAEFSAADKPGEAGSESPAAGPRHEDARTAVLAVTGPAERREFLVFLVLSFFQVILSIPDG
jgi:hypothetical protein